MKKRGFTLAEVLITLVIIGVIAALTIPTLVKANKRTETETGLKNTYSILSNALKLSSVDNDEFNTWDFTLAAPAFFDQYLRPYLKFSKECTASQPCNNYTIYRTGGGVFDWWPATNETGGFLSNGVYVASGNSGPVGQNTCQNSSYGCIMLTVDINGAKSPNTLGKDVFWMNAYPDGKLAAPGVPGIPSQQLDPVINICKTETSSGHSGYYCTGWIMSNGWKIPDDYPWL